LAGAVAEVLAPATLGYPADQQTLVAAERRRLVVLVDLFAHHHGEHRVSCRPPSQIAVPFAQFAAPAAVTFVVEADCVEQQLRETKIHVQVGGSENQTKILAVLTLHVGVVLATAISHSLTGFSRLHLFWG
jgi:hypothetical protein